MSYTPPHIYRSTPHPIYDSHVKVLRSNLILNWHNWKIPGMKTLVDITFCLWKRKVEYVSLIFNESLKHILIVTFQYYPSK